MRELEVKIAMNDPREARRLLGRAGLTALAPRLLEDNRLYDRADRALEVSEQVLRLRSTGGRHTLTFKKRTKTTESEALYKVRVEHETRVDEPDEVDAMLTELGYEVTFRYQKYRQSYARGAVEVDLDETPLGTYLELEGPAEAIDELARDLGFSPSSYITASYIELLRELSGDPRGVEFVFPETP